MSSARLPIALAVLGLAACAHTPSDSTLSIANARNAAPVLVVESDEVPNGYDEHVVMIIDQQGLEREQRNDPGTLFNHPYYGYPVYDRRNPGSAVPQSTPAAQDAGIPRSDAGAVRSIRPPESVGNRRSRN